MEFIVNTGFQSSLQEDTDVTKMLYQFVPCSVLKKDI